MGRASLFVILVLSLTTVLSSATPKSAVASQSHMAKSQEGSGSLNPLARLRVLADGLTAHQVSASVAVGTYGGLFPVLGFSTVSCLGLNAVIGGNVPLTLAASWLPAPLLVLMLPRFAELGARVTGIESGSADAAAVMSMFKEDFRGALRAFGPFLALALVGWVVVAPAALSLCYLLARGVLEAGGLLFRGGVASRGGGAGGATCEAAGGAPGRKKALEGVHQGAEHRGAVESVRAGGSGWTTRLRRR